MPPATRHAPIVLLAALLLAGCNSATGSADNAPSRKTTPTSATAGGSGRTIATGPGPQTHYTVQQQPPAGSCHYRYDNKQPLEDPACTPGAISPAVTQANLTTTICHKGGYTSGIRPSAYITGKEKALNATSYGYTGPMRDAEYDHLLSGVVTVSRVISPVHSVSGMPLTSGLRGDGPRSQPQAPAAKWRSWPC